MDEKDTQLSDFVDETIRTLGGSEVRTLDEETLRHEIRALDPRAPIVVEPQASVLEAIALMQQNRVGCVLVARGGKLKGIFTERDVLTDVVGKAIDPAKTPIRRLMTPNPESLRLTDSIAYALNKMSVGGYRHIPLVDESLTPVGIISVRDIINYIVRLFPKSVINLPTLPRQNYTQQREGA
jgi:CBS domain-containing protein